MNKLFIFEDSSACFFGGGQRVSLDVIDSLLPIYESVTIFDYNIESEFCKRANKRGVNLISLRRMNGLFFIFKYILNLITIYNSFKGSDCVAYISTKKGLVYTPFINRWINKTIYHVHNIEIKNSYKYLFLYFLFFVDEIICVSNSVLDNIPKWIKNKINSHVVYNCSSLLVNKKKYEYKEDLIFVFFGSLIDIKGIDILIDAFLLTFDSMPRDKLLICGSGPISEQLIKKASIDSRIQFLGFISCIDNILNTSDVLILPTKIAEACPMSIIEAHYSSVPVITSNIGGQNELLSISNFGVGFENKNIISCMESIKKFKDKDFFESIFINSKLENFYELTNREKFSSNIKRIFTSS